MLKVVNLTCGYGKRTILSDINFQVGSGELLGIIGPNGSGKTTLLRALSRVIAPIDGKVLWQDGNIQTIAVKELARDISVVSQGTSLNDLTVEEFVFFRKDPLLQCISIH
ncbi:MAG: ATP-binding cassette domain-containing protein [Smithellaceae bacterium]